MKNGFCHEGLLCYCISHFWSDENLRGYRKGIFKKLGCFPLLHPYSSSVEVIIKWTTSSEFGTYSICVQRRFRRACASTHTSSESRGTLRQKARSLAPLNGWACTVKICHDGMLEDTNLLDGAQIIWKKRILWKYWQQQTPFDWVCSWERMTDATSLTPSSPGLSAALFPNKSVEPYSPKGPENVKNSKLYWCTERLFRAATWHNDSCCDL